MSASSILTSELQTTICGARLNADFKSILQFVEIQQSDEDDEVKAERIASALFPDGAPDDPELGEELQKFLSHGEQGEEGGRKLIDFTKDSGRIYASFYQAYGVDLTKENLHWWCFLDLLKALPEETILKRVIEIRSKNLSDCKTPEERISLLKLQVAYSLGDDEE